MTFPTGCLPFQPNFSPFPSIHASLACEHDLKPMLAGMAMIIYERRQLASLFIYLLIDFLGSSVLSEQWFCINCFTSMIIYSERQSGEFLNALCILICTGIEFPCRGGCGLRWDSQGPCFEGHGVTTWREWTLFFFPSCFLFWVHPCSPLVPFWREMDEKSGERVRVLYLKCVCVWVWRKNLATRLFAAWCGIKWSHGW